MEVASIPNHLGGKVPPWRSRGLQCGRTGGNCSAVPAWERSFSSICESAVFCIKENKSVFNHFLLRTVAFEFLHDSVNFSKRWALVKFTTFVVLQRKNTRPIPRPWQAAGSVAKSIQHHRFWLEMVKLYLFKLKLLDWIPCHSSLPCIAYILG